MVKVFIANSRPVVREGLRALLHRIADFHVEGETGDGREVVSKVLALRIQLLILDMELSGRDGLDVLHDLKQSPAGARRLVFTALPERDYALRALEAGAAGYLRETAPMTDLTEAVRTVAGGATFLTKAVQELILNRMQKRKDGLPHEQLSDRELQVVERIGRGQAIKSIGAELGLSPKTITSFRARALQKLNMETNAELVYYARTSMQAGCGLSLQ